jgi:hypothetical protein
MLGDTYIYRTCILFLCGLKYWIVILLCDKLKGKVKGKEKKIKILNGSKVTDLIEWLFQIK